MDACWRASVSVCVSAFSRVSGESEEEVEDEDEEEDNDDDDDEEEEEEDGCGCGGGSVEEEDEGSFDWICFLGGIGEEDDDDAGIGSFVEGVRDLAFGVTL